MSLPSPPKMVVVIGASTPREIDVVVAFEGVDRHRVDAGTSVTMANEPVVLMLIALAAEVTVSTPAAPSRFTTSTPPPPVTTIRADRRVSKSGLANERKLPFEAVGVVGEGVVRRGAVNSDPVEGREVIAVVNDMLSRSEVHRGGEPVASQTSKTWSA